MATAFTEDEKALIIAKLKACAREYMGKYGIKKTSVDQLVAGAGISKGAFYKFYDTKELLFFEVFEDFHSEIYGTARAILQTRTDLPERQRMEEALLQACKRMQQSSLMEMMENELTYLLRKIPAETRKKHYHSDDIHIQELIQNSGIQISASPAFASAVVRAVMLTLTQQKSIGEEYYEDVLRLLISGICGQLTGEGKGGMEEAVHTDSAKED